METKIWGEIKWNMKQKLPVLIVNIVESLQDKQIIIQSIARSVIMN